MTLSDGPKQSESHAALLDEFRTATAEAWFDAIVVPTHRPVGSLQSCIELAEQTETTLIVMCSKVASKDGAASKEEVYRRAAQAKVKVFAFDLDDRSGDPLGIDFATSRDPDLSAASPGWNRDLSMKRNIGLVLARLCGWARIMFLDDDIYEVERHHVTALAGALENHHVSALIPKRYPDNSVVCHAYRLGGGDQDVFASASGIGVRCDRDTLAFFPNIYNEDWFFLANEAANHLIARVGESRQRQYDPYDSPNRATWQEFGDLLAEGLYAQLDIGKDIQDVDTGYWREFIETRRNFHQLVAESLALVEADKRDEAARAAKSVRAAQDQLDLITPDLCMKFIHNWRQDLTRWQRYLAGLPRLDSIEAAFDYLSIDYRPSLTSGPLAPL